MQQWELSSARKRSRTGHAFGLESTKTQVKRSRTQPATKAVTHRSQAITLNSNPQVKRSRQVRDRYRSRFPSSLRDDGETPVETSSSRRFTRPQIVGVVSGRRGSPTDVERRKGVSEDVGPV